MGDQTEEIVETVETTVTHTESVEVHETTEFTEIVEVTETIVTSGKAAEGAGATGGKNRPDLSSFSSEDQEKIGRIQAQGRGYIARKNVEEKKSYRETTTSEIKETKQQSGTAAGGSLTTTELTESRTTTEENETKETVETTEELITEAVTVGGGNIASLEDWNSGAADAGADAAGAESGAVPCIDGQPKPHEQPDPAGPQSSERDSASGRVHGASAAAQDVPGTEAPSAVSSEPVHFVPASGDAPRNPKPLGTGLSTVAPAAQKHKASEPAADKPAGVAASLEAQGGQGGGGDHVPSQTDRAPARASESAFAQQDGSQTAMVTFVVKPENIKYAREVKLSLNCLDLKSELYDELRILPEALTLKLGEAEWYAHMSLRELGVKVRFAPLAVPGQKSPAETCRR